ncbi:Major facilitator superfamily domain-containing protein 1 [Operophtera brumata]|uniref:Lysosomal dipeptide transporter MFSD1 n=1 Tax=Operophtera brumata TaxID=104452 RepID=A0A0L7LQF4_OPEBR|nr:Major facilitator superfamily domain-containing protein 1 [Operophtera brumata]
MDSEESSRSSRAQPVPLTSWAHPANRVHRFFALLLMCFLCFGSYFCYDTPGALADNFKDDSHLNTSQFALLYSIYSWPNVILCFIGGYLVDRYFGVRLGTVIYMTIVLIGAVVFAMGVYVNAFWLMILGRFIFGIGGESLQVAVNNYVVLWFKGKELNMVFGLQLSFSRFGSTVNFWVMEPIYKYAAHYYHGYEQLGVCLFVASLTCLGSLICGLLLGWMDYRAEKILCRQEERANEEPFHLSDIRHFKSVFWLVSVICVALFYERKFDFSPQEANNVNSMVYLLSAALSPFFGILIDKTGRNVTWMLLGISYSLLASGLWPLVALIVPENQLGTAYGICQAVQNMGLATVLILVGVIVDRYGYLMLEINGILNMSPSMRDSAKPVDSDETANLLDNDDFTDQEEVDSSRPNESPQDSPLAHRDSTLEQSDRIRSRYLSQILPNNNIP